MAIFHPKDTLSFQFSRVLTTHRDMRDTPCANVAQALANYEAQHIAVVNPEREAVRFYGLNHGIALIRAKYAPLEPLPKEALSLVTAYHKSMQESALAAFYYLLKICIREFRHNKSLSKDAPYIEKTFGNPVKNFLTKTGGESAIMTRFMSAPPDAPIGALVGAIRWGFYNSSWQGGYGGKAWGNITDCLLRFVEGEYTGEIMLDTSFTLSHNNGPIYNKGFIYQSHGHRLLEVLDVQRSGQIPEYIRADGSMFADVTLKKQIVTLEKMFPDAFGKYVDWFKVKALGAVGQYNQQQAEQLTTHGPSYYSANADKIKASKLAQEKQKALEFAKNNIEIYPGQFVSVVQRAA